VSAATPALLAAAAGVGFGHAILPDHWLPLAAVGRSQRYPLARVARLSGLAGVAHVLVSIVLGGVIIAVGLQLRSSVQSAQSTIVGCLLIATAIGFALFELRGHGHRHAHAHAHEKPASGTPGAERLRGWAAVMVPFGAAASPDLTILPVFLAATTAGVVTAVGSLVVFAVVTIATIVGLTLAACFGGYQLSGRWLERWGNSLTALVLLAVGCLVLVRVL
jgi:hypothetical protein